VPADGGIAAIGRDTVQPKFCGIEDPECEACQ
jgi:hypothetical protein